MSILESVADPVNLRGVPAIPGLVFRHFRGGPDFPAMAALMNAVSEADFHPVQSGSTYRKPMA